MKIQRNIIYTMIIGSIVSALIYAYCVFQWNPNTGDKGYDLHTYISNIILGVWGSSIISLILGMVSYSECRRKDMEAFIFFQRALFEHCSSFKEKNSEKWFEEYVKLYRDLSNNWTNIKFLFDPLRRRLFLKAFVDYYGDFIQLTQDKYNLLKQNVTLETKEKLLNDIKGIVVEKQTYTQGIMNRTVEYNLLTHDLEMAIKNIDNIYRCKKSLHKYKFKKTLISSDNFTILDKENENYVRKICKKMDRTNSTEIDFRMPKKNADHLKKYGYLSNYILDDTEMTSKINCNFIVDHYFEMKKRYICNIYM